MPLPALTPQGLQIATLADNRDQINAAWRGAFGASMDVSDGSPDGQLIGIVSEFFAIVNEVLEAIVASQDPSKALDAALDAICALIGLKRPGATFSRVTLTLTGTPTTPVPDGSLASTASTGQQFTTAGAGTVTIVAATAWATGTTYAVGDRRTNASGIYLCTVGGLSAASGPGPTSTTRGVDIPDGSGPLVWRFVGPGTGLVDVVARATVTGPIVAVSGDITIIATPIGGWQGVFNALDAVPGTNVATNPQLRVLREQELAKPGTSPKNAIRAALLDVGGVTSCSVFSNVTDITDSNGIPPHSILAMVKGGADQDIWDALLANVADGIRTTGTVVGTSVDSEGTPQTMAFSRVTEVLVYVVISLTVDATKFPTDGAAQIAAAIATNGNALDDGTDVTAAWVLAQAFTIAGVRNGSLPFIGTAPGPASTADIVITQFQRAVYDTSRVSVTATPGAP